MTTRKRLLVFLSLLFLLTACSNNETNGDSGSSEAGDSATFSRESAAPERAQDHKMEGESKEAASPNQAKLIYQSQVDLETKNYDQFYEDLQKEIKKYKARIVNINLHKGNEGNRKGNLTIRVPQEHFQNFMDGIGSYSSEIISKQTSAQDVTEQYVDYKSRLEAKKKVEQRLLSFLDGAKKTDDLVAISKDLERVQEEMESLQGKMNYLNDQSEYSTVNLSFIETKVVVPAVNNRDLNTWEKTKQAFNSSINGLTSLFSAVTVFLLGYSPILLIIAALAVVIWFIVRRKRQHPS
ncbi:DUF4349 domain-containing protein [Halobacillus salinarum]|uniref:DUF4349 domain-containing protein n=1 Tax=Halobacillus salinarum TaxID=2932257 RepID=A0ABY4EMX8_9BACI|nr:DUF4349 domain-containing protein [Halobacillus salinarum]UOQ43466.1 DUF4349 domain-containing protein [Halobacillus salinarum]